MDKYMIFEGLTGIDGKSTVWSARENIALEGTMEDVISDLRKLYEIPETYKAKVREWKSGDIVIKFVPHVWFYDPIVLRLNKIK